MGHQNVEPKRCACGKLIGQNNERCGMCARKRRNEKSVAAKRARVAAAWYAENI